MPRGLSGLQSARARKSCGSCWRRGLMRDGLRAYYTGRTSATSTRAKAFRSRRGRRARLDEAGHSTGHFASHRSIGNPVTGTSYVTSKHLLDELMRRPPHQLGDGSRRRRVLFELNAAWGVVIPVAMIRFQGRVDAVRSGI